MSSKKRLCVTGEPSFQKFSKKIALIPWLAYAPSQFRSLRRASSRSSIQSSKTPFACPASFSRMRASTQNQTLAFAVEKSCVGAVTDPSQVSLAKSL